MDLDDARTLARELMDAHGLGQWRFAFDRAVRRAGKCSYGTNTISLSAPITRLHDEAEVRETLLHEIAHALTPGEGHSAVWRQKAISIGSNGERCVDADAPSVPGAWVGTCAAGHTVERHRAPQRVFSCPKCSKRFSRDHLFTWRHRGNEVVMPPSYRMDLQRIKEQRPAVVAAVGARVEIVVPGRYQGMVATVEKRTRVNYVVRAGNQLLRLPHSGAVPVQE